jgi:cyclohexanecarboxylate-CoA ligase
VSTSTTSAADSLPRGQYTPVTAADAAAFRASGAWQGRTVRSLLAESAAAHPDRMAVCGYRRGEGVVRRTYGQLDGDSRRAAAALAALGVGPGDVVAVMLANRVEYPTLVFAINEIGAVYTGIPVAYGELQARAILQHSGAKVLVIQRTWGSSDILALARSLRSAVPALERVIALDDGPEPLADGEVAWSGLAAEPGRSFPDPAPGEVCYLGFTSGTTGPPKGAMHSHETLVYTARALAEHIGTGQFGESMVQIVASPMGHHTGYAWGILFTAHLGGTAVLVDRWDPAWAAEVIRAEQVTAFFGAPTFLQDLMRTGLAGDPGCPLTCVVVAGSPVPRTLPARAAEALGAYIAPAWGMTECGILTCCTPREPDAIFSTDGSAFAGSAVRVVDGQLRDLPAGVTGELLMRGPGVTLGYYNRPDASKAAFMPGLWFRTGDTASLDERGWLSIHGRRKDIIIRGGENIPVTDVETLLFDHPDVLNAALVGYPDERLGERACAVLALRAGAALDLPKLCAYLLGAGLSKHYLPERLMVLDELPTTQSGKIQKFRLREILAQWAGQA